jgi:hypothetical protein
MYYTVEVHQLLNKKQNVIGSCVIAFKRDENHNLIGCLNDYYKFTGEEGHVNVDDRNFIIEDEFNSAKEMENTYEFHKENLTNFLI